MKSLKGFPCVEVWSFGQTRSTSPTPFWLNRLKGDIFMAYYRRIGKSWYYTVRITDSKGLRRTIERFGGTTRTQAKQAALDFLASCETTGSYVKVATMKYSVYLDEFMKVYVKPNLRNNTQDPYINYIENIIKPQLGEYTLEKLTPLNIQTMINGLADKYSYRTLEHILAVVKKSLSEAVGFFNYLAYNPAKAVRLPKLKQEETKAEPIVVFDNEDMLKIFEAFPSSHPFYAPIRLAWFTGMRIGECLGLQWEDIDMEKQVIHVRHTLYDKRWVELTLPKTKGSNRLISFGQNLKNVLLTVKENQEIRKKEYAGYYEESDFVCTRDNGQVLTSERLRYFGTWCKKKLGHGSFHTIRHTHATNLFTAGWSIDDVSKRLGHTSSTITSRVYSHVSRNRIEKQIKMLDELSM